MPRKKADRDPSAHAPKDAPPKSAPPWMSGAMPCSLHVETPGRLLGHILRGAIGDAALDSPSSDDNERRRLRDATVLGELRQSVTAYADSQMGKAGAAVLEALLDTIDVGINALLLGEADPASAIEEDVAEIRDSARRVYTRAVAQRVEHATPYAFGKVVVNHVQGLIDAVAAGIVRTEIACGCGITLRKGSLACSFRETGHAEPTWLCDVCAYGVLAAAIAMRIAQLGSGPNPALVRLARVSDGAAFRAALLDVHDDVQRKFGAAIATGRGLGSGARGATATWTDPEGTAVACVEIALDALGVRWTDIKTLLAAVHRARR